jgi:hypothetical protein
VAEELVWKQVEALLRHPAVVLDEIAQVVGCSLEAEETPQMKSGLLRDALDAKQEERQQAITLCTRRLITPQDLARQLERIDTETEVLRGQIRDVELDIRQAMLIEADLAGVEAALRRFRSLAEDRSWESRRWLLCQVVQNISVETANTESGQQVVLHTTYTFAHRAARHGTVALLYPDMRYRRMQDSRRRAPGCPG